MRKIDVGFLARVVRVAWEAAFLRDCGHDDHGAANTLEQSAHELWMEAGFEDADTRDLCMWAEMVGERFAFSPHQHEYIPQAWNWGILRSPGQVKSTFYGTQAAVYDHVDALNKADDAGSSEVITLGMFDKDANDWLQE